MRKPLFLLLLPIVVCGHAQTVQDSLLTADGYRTYLVHTPPGFTPSEHLPVVFNLHGLGSTNAQQEAYSGMNAVADTARFIVVYPNGVNGSWNLGLGQVDEYGFFSGLLDTIAAVYGTDMDRVYACGMSQGGFMSFVLACAFFNRVAAVASVSGSMAPGLDLVCAPTRPVPVMMIHGTADAIVPYSGGLQNLSVPTAIDFWVDHNSCATVPMVTPLPDIVTWDFCTAVREDHLNGAQGSEVALIRVVDGGHTWPGSSIPLGVTNQDMNASATLWAFFDRFNMSGATSSPEPLNEAAAPLELPALFTGHVDLRNRSFDPIDVTVFDAAGRVIHRAHIPAQGLVPVNASPWCPGPYLWQARSSNGTTVQRAVLVP